MCIEDGGRGGGGNCVQLVLHRSVMRWVNNCYYFNVGILFCFPGTGGDDVQQLCEAGEDEFLEIMALVGMASKPLHVRRLQKALQEWVANPAAFEGKHSFLVFFSFIQNTKTKHLYRNIVFSVMYTLYLVNKGY